MKQSTRKKPKSSPHKNLCRCIYPTFTGIRLAIQRKGFTFSKYLPLKGSDWESIEAEALAERDFILSQIEGLNEARLLKFFNQYRAVNRA